MRTWAPKGQTPIIQFHFNWTHISVIAGLSRSNCLFRLHEGSVKKELTLSRFHVHQIVGNFLMKGGRDGDEGIGCESAVHGGVQD